MRGAERPGGAWRGQPRAGHDALPDASPPRAGGRAATPARSVVALACAALYVAADLALRPIRLPTSHTIPWYPGAGLAFVALIVAGAPAAGLLYVARVLLALWPPGPAGPIWLILLDAAGVVGGYALAATVARRHLRFRGGAWRARDALWLSASIVAAGLVAGATSVAIRVAGGGLDAARLWSALLSFAAGDAAGAMVIVPLALFVVLPERRRRDGPPVATGSPDDAVAVRSTRRRRLERAGQAAVVAATVATGVTAHARGGVVLGYACFLPLAWVALREGVRGAALVIAAYGVACGGAGL